MLVHFIFLNWLIMLPEASTFIHRHKRPSFLTLAHARGANQIHLWSVDTLTEALRSFETQLGESREQDPRGLSSSQQAREILLNSRIPNLMLNHSRLSSESIAGRGLFASKDIYKGDLITCYPGDILVYSPTDALIVGDHVPESMRDVENDDYFNGLLDYSLSEDEDYSVIALPELDSDPSYLGHFCNDAACLEEGGFYEYTMKSSRGANAVHTDLKGLHMVTIATQDIHEGEEILVSYGADYWAEHNARSGVDTEGFWDVE